jgi:hypothetical protein
MLKFKNIFYVNFWPSSVTLTFNRHKGNIDFADNIVEVNIWVKFEENSSISTGFIEQKRHIVKYLIVCKFEDLKGA